MKKDKEKITNVWAQVFSVGEDLQCSNLKVSLGSYGERKVDHSIYLQPIPIVPRRLETGLPDEFIGDGLFILEFLRIFGSQFDKALQFIDASVWGKYPLVFLRKKCIFFRCVLWLMDGAIIR